MGETKIRTHLATLQKRADHLANRIANDQRDLAWDKAELAALRWAIPVLIASCRLELRDTKKTDRIERSLDGPLASRP